MSSGMTSQIEVSLLCDQLQHFEAVIALGDRFKRKLGLFPRDALEESARAGEVLIAHESDLLVGYLLFRVSRKHPRRATIIHLCVEPSRRGEGIARTLVDELKSRTRELDGIRLTCRRDYEENALWPRLGFQLLGEKRGKSKAGTPLNIWWFAHGSPLLSYISRMIAEQSVVVALDANVVFDLVSDGPASIESQALLNDWLREQVDFIVTPELNNEINRSEDPTAREKSRQVVGRFRVLEGDGATFESARSSLSEMLGHPSDENQASDIRQIAWAIAGEAEYFVTRDQGLLDRAREIGESFNINVVRPSEIITQIDEFVNGASYQPHRFEGSLLGVRPVDPSAEQHLVDSYLDFASEKKAPFLNVLRSALATCPGQVREIVGAHQEPYLLYHLEELNGEIFVPLLRASKARLSATVLRQFLASLTFRRAVSSVSITDNRLSSPVEQALAAAQFIKLQSGWLKPCLRYIGPASEVPGLLASTYPDSTHRDALNEIGTTLSDGRPEQLLTIERALAPAKFTDLEIPCFIVSIRPFWASQLFDSKLAEQDLFGLPPELGFRLENVYYKAAGFPLRGPARVLWYVSMGKRGYTGTGAIRAASYLDEVIIGPPKELYSRFRRLGIYQWGNVLNITKGALDEAVMALRFSGTELLDKPIGWDEIQAKLAERTGKGNPLLGPVQITSTLFFELYSKATGTQITPVGPP